MDELIREALRERCVQLALHLRADRECSALLDEVEELAREHWAFRSEDDS
jgi:hypothetical protein